MNPKEAEKTAAEFTNFFAGGDEKREEMLAQPAGCPCVCDCYCGCHCSCATCTCPNCTCIPPQKCNCLFLSSETTYQGEYDLSTALTGDQVKSGVNSGMVTSQANATRDSLQTTEANVSGGYQGEVLAGLV